MKKLTLILLIGLGSLATAIGQIEAPKFGKGIRILGKDSTYYSKIGFRFQNLYVGDWTLSDDNNPGSYDAAFLVRRMRLKFDGWAFNPRVTYKLEIALSNRDNAGGSGAEFRKAANAVLDASVAYNFYKNFTIQFGQRKLPGNRERVISSGNLQFVDRSRVNSRYNIDRDVGLQLKHHFTIGDNFLIREVAALSQGEGRNVTAGYFGGFNYTYRVEFLPFGKFSSKGDYIGSAIAREETPKLSVGITYDNNRNSVRERGQLGSFIQDEAGNYLGKDLNTLFIDMMLNYKGISIMGEYADKQTGDDDPNVYDAEGTLVGTFFTGTGLNLQAGYMFENNMEIAARYTTIDAQVATDENQYTFGVNKFFVGHKLKIQNDFTLIERDGSQNSFQWRTQVDIHF